VDRDVWDVPFCHGALYHRYVAGRADGERNVEQHGSELSPFASAEFGSTISSKPAAPSAGRSGGMRTAVPVVALAWVMVGLVAISGHIEAIKDIAAGELGTLMEAARSGADDPRDPGNEAGSILCRDVSATHAARLTRGFALMRRSGEGKRLYQELIDNDVCVTVRTLKEWSGVAFPRWSVLDGWGHSTIDVDREHLETAGLDVLATTLIHEATHLDRAIQGTYCEASGSCTVFANDVVLEEEVAAHAAEARLWIGFYGRDGKADPEPEAAWENTLAAAYLAGPATFRQFVADTRADDPTLTITQ
jgi:hypothetical protein